MTEWWLQLYSSTVSWFQWFWWFQWSDASNDFNDSNDSSDSNDVLLSYSRDCSENSTSVTSIVFNPIASIEQSSRPVIIRTIAPSSDPKVYFRLHSKQCTSKWKVARISSERVNGRLSVLMCLKFEFQIRCYWCQYGFYQTKKSLLRRVTRWAWHRAISNAWQLATMEQWPIKQRAFDLIQSS